MSTRIDLIPADRLPVRATRDAETYLKRQTFKVEQAAALALLALYREAYRDIALAVSSELRRAEAEARIAERVNRLRRDVLVLLGLSVGAAFVGGYYGKLWLLDMSTRPDVPVRTRRLIASLDEQLRAQVNVELDALTVDVRRVLVAGVAGSLLLSRLRKTMGADSTRNAARGNFNRVLVLTRTGVQSAVNTGSLIAVRENGVLIDGTIHLTTLDERTCPICAPLDGRFYPLDSTQDLPPIHPNCRCTRIPRIRDDLLVEPTAPLRQTFTVWATAAGVMGLLSAFLTP